MKTKKCTWFTTSLLCGLFSLGLASSVEAGTIYDYTGPDFTSYSGADNSSAQTDMTASFTLASPLGANFNGFVLPSAFEIGDGSVTLTNASPDITVGPNVDNSFFYFATNGAGQIIYWDVDIQQSYSLPDWRQLFTEAYADNSITCGGGFPDECNPNLGQAVEFNPSNDNLNWTEAQTASTPEPATFGMIAVAFAALALQRRKGLTR